MNWNYVNDGMVDYSIFDLGSSFCAGLLKYFEINSLVERCTELHL